MSVEYRQLVEHECERIKGINTAGSSEDTLALYGSLGCIDAKEINQELYESDENDMQLECDIRKKE